MLVTFSTGYYSDITMFGEVAEHLIKLMGHSGTIPGAIVSGDVPQALDRLKQGIAEEPNAEVESSSEDDEQSPTSQVSLRKRALPLISLLESAKNTHSDVMWK